MTKDTLLSELNDSQRTAVEEILEKIKSGTVERVVVNGMP